MNKPKLNKKEEQFCRLYALLRNPEQAAMLCGYTGSLEKGLELLESTRIQQKIRELDGGSMGAVKAGFTRLAFGQVGDAVRLLLSGEECDQGYLDGLDLFNVSEIKRVKGGGFEIKFVDRMQALDRLGQICRQEAEKQDSSFIEALTRSAAALGDADIHGQV